MAKNSTCQFCFIRMNFPENCHPEKCSKIIHPNEKQNYSVIPLIPRHIGKKQGFRPHYKNI
jgi:hypothetical protein